MVAERCTVDLADYSYEKHHFTFLEVLKWAFVEPPAHEYSLPEFSGKIIAYGILGSCGRLHLKALADTPLAPDELWDIAGDGETVKKPEFERLAKDDLVIVFPLFVSIKTPCPQMSMSEVVDFLRDTNYKETVARVREALG
jgi:hypothetical protein